MALFGAWRIVSVVSVRHPRFWLVWTRQLEDVATVCRVAALIFCIMM